MDHDQALEESQSSMGEARRRLNRSRKCFERSRICIEKSDFAVRESRIEIAFCIFSIEDQTRMQRKYIDALCGSTEAPEPRKEHGC